MKREKKIRNKKEQNEVIYKFYQLGLSMYQLADAFGITQPRVHQIIKEMRAKEKKS
jgi:predicted DNA-binding protein YlxM (UPF0122 family)